MPRSRIPVTSLCGLCERAGRYLQRLNAVLPIEAARQAERMALREERDAIEAARQERVAEHASERMYQAPEHHEELLKTMRRSAQEMAKDNERAAERAAARAQEDAVRAERVAAARAQEDAERAERVAAARAERVAAARAQEDAERAERVERVAKRAAARAQEDAERAERVAKRAEYVPGSAPWSDAARLAAGASKADLEGSRAATHAKKGQPAVATTQQKMEMMVLKISYPVGITRTQAKALLNQHKNK
jgi:hypothetical protein